jgi:hypothetical protein
MQYIIINKKIELNSLKLTKLIDIAETKSGKENKFTNWKKNIFIVLEKISKIKIINIVQIISKSRISRYIEALL